MNRIRMLIIGFASFTLSALVAFVAYRVLSNRLNASPDETREIVVAAQKLSLGMRLSRSHLRTVPWPKAVQVEGSFADPKQAVGRGVVVPMLPNEPVLGSKLAPKEAGIGLTSAIPEGMRAVSVKVDDIIGVAGLVLPGTVSAEAVAEKAVALAQTYAQNVVNLLATAREQRAVLLQVRFAEVDRAAIQKLGSTSSARVPETLLAP